jgi:alpha-tubulin suppressor-like RCC1 family protein
VGAATWAEVSVGGDLAASAEQVCATSLSAEVSCWGTNVGGELGDGTTLGRSAPGSLWQAPGLTGLVAGGGHSCALDQDGRAWCWGRDDAGQRGDGHGSEPRRVVEP